MAVDDAYDTSDEVDGASGRERRWIWRDVQRCWCWRLWRTWRVAAERGVVGEMAAEDMSVVSAEGSGGVARGFEDGGGVSLVILMVCFILFSFRRGRRSRMDSRR